MAIAFDAVTPKAGSTVSSQISWTHTSTGSGLYMVVFVSVTHAVSVVNSVTYNSVGMSLLASVTNGAGADIYAYTLASPTSGANTVLVTLNTNDFVDAASLTYTGVGGIDASTSGIKAASATPSFSLNTVADNSWAILGETAAGSDTITAGGIRRSVNGGQGNCTFDSNAAITPAGTATMTLSGPNSARNYVMLSLAPPTTAAKHRMFMVF